MPKKKNPCMMCKGTGVQPEPTMTELEILKQGVDASKRWKEYMDAADRVVALAVAHSTGYLCYHHIDDAIHDYRKAQRSL
jgi:hypothetical protein